MYNDGYLRGDDDFARFNNFCKCFIKNEAYPIYKFPRGIYARKDDFKMRVGPIFKLIEKELFNLPYFVKYIPVDERAKYIHELFGDCPAVIGSPYEFIRRYMATDFTAFEASFTADVMNDCEMQLYEFMVQFLPEGERFMRLLRQVLLLENDCRFRSVMVKMQAGRMSGEMNTSLGNGFTNLMLMLFAMSEFNCEHAVCLIEGDDGIAAYTGPLIPDAFYEQLGFTIKIIYHSTLNTASFCGQVFDFETYTIVADPIKVLLNFSWAHPQYMNCRPKKIMGLLRCKALSLLYQYPGCPVLQSFAVAVLRLTKEVLCVRDLTLDAWHRDIQSTAIDRDYRHLLHTRKVALSTRQVMADVFRISVIDQIILENYFTSLTKVEPLWHPVLLTYIADVCFDFDRHYTTDREHLNLDYCVYGAISDSLQALINVIENEER